MSNDHPIDLVDDKQPLYGPIYGLGPVELVWRAYTAAEALPSCAGSLRRSGFANFYRRFSQGISKIAAPLISMLRASSLTDLSTSAAQSVVEYDEVVDGGGGGKSNEKLSKAKNTAEQSFLTSDARLAFTRLRQAFTESPKTAKTGYETHDGHR